MYTLNWPNVGPLCSESKMNTVLAPPAPIAFHTSLCIYPYLYIYISSFCCWIKAYHFSILLQFVVSCQFSAVLYLVAEFVILVYTTLHYTYLYISIYIYIYIYISHFAWLKLYLRLCTAAAQTINVMLLYMHILSTICTPSLTSQMYSLCNIYIYIYAHAGKCIAALLFIVPIRDF